MADPTDNRTVHLDTDRARGASTPGVARYVLIASLVLVIVVFLGIYFLR